MTFPLIPLALTAELFIGGGIGWVDITSDVRLESAASGGGISITRGQSVEGNQADPGRLNLTLDNRSGRYSPRNPRGEWYGLFGRNTPIRLGVDLAADPFTRTVAGGLGTTPDGRTWTSVGTASEYTVAGSYATHQHPTKNVNHYSYLDREWQDIEQVTKTSIAAVPTGATVVAGHIARYNPATGDHYWLRLVWTPDATVWVQILKRVGGTYTTLLTKTEVGTFTAGQSYLLRSSVAGGRLSLKVWAAGAVEPADWTASTVDGSITAAGRAGLASRVDTGNTNITEARFDDYEAINRRFFGEVSVWPPRSDLGGFDRWVPIEASGILRRLNQGTQPSQSPMRRSFVASDPQAYWPMEDGLAANAAASAVPGVSPMMVTGAAQFVSIEDSTFGSNPTLRYGTSALLDLSGGGMTKSGSLPQAATDATRQAWTATVSAGVDVLNASGDVVLLEVNCSSNLTAAFLKWQLVIRKATLRTQVVAYDRLNTPTVVIDDPGVYTSFAQYDFTVWQSGVNTISVGYASQGGGVFSLTGVVSGTLLGVTEVSVNPTRQTQSTEMPFGHVAIWASQGTPMLQQANDSYGVNVYGAAYSYWRETATDRLARLCAEHGIPLSMPAVSTDGVVRMGWQPQATLGELLAECVEADGGILTEQRDGLGLAYRPRESLYNQKPLALSFTAGHISDAQPAEDDNSMVNDVTVTRSNGSTYRLVQTAGRLAAVPPPDGVGVYDTTVQVNLATDEQLPDQTGWRLHFGTVDEPRYPRIRANFAAGGWSSNPGLSSRAQSLDSGDVLSLNDTPDWLPPGPAKAMVRGYTETMDAFDWDIEWNATPASPWDVGVVGETRVAAIGTVLTAGITTSAISFQITSTADNGPWQTDPAHFPQDLIIGGERMTVSGISGTGLTQTVTVTARAVNGISWAWLAGAGVQIADVRAIAL